MLHPTSSPLIFPTLRPSFLLHPRHTDNHFHPTFNTHNPTHGCLIQEGPHNHSFDPHTVSPSPYIFNLTRHTKVPGHSTNCLCYPTTNPTLYLRDQ